jgi:NodT family efflux transporter outer membrane factor (OMF) lipoprotein
VPDLGPKPQLRAAESVAASQSFAATSAAWPVDRWWDGLGDPQLSALIDEGLRNSPDVAIAAARFRRAQGMAQEAGAARLPSVDVQGGASLDKQSYNNGFPKEFVPKGWQDRGSIAATLDFDLDMWGRNRAAYAAASSGTQAARLDSQQARLALAAGITSAYSDLQRLIAERDARAQILEMRQTSLRLVADRFRAGLDARGSERAAAAAVETARGDVSAIDQQIGTRRNQIAALIGAGPDRGLAIAPPHLSAASGLGVPDDATTALVARRPDLIAARDRAEAAAKRIDVAHADFFPSIRLSALVGLQSLGLDSLLKADSLYGNVGPAVSLPIFHGGALSGRYREARAGFDEAVAVYDKAVVTAYQEVADAVNDRRLLAERLRSAEAAVAASREAYGLAQQRYKAGLSTYLDVLSVEDRLQQNRLQVVAIAAAARAADVALIRALGGGFATPAALPAKDGPDE